MESLDSFFMTGIMEGFVFFASLSIFLEAIGSGKAWFEWMVKKGFQG